MSEPMLFPPNNSTPTSCAAARAIAPATKTIRAAVLRELIARAGYGATDEELQLVLGLRTQTETPRRGELVKLGLVRDSGRRRPTSSGREATVWVAHCGGEPA